MFETPEKKMENLTNDLDDVRRKIKAVLEKLAEIEEEEDKEIRRIEEEADRVIVPIIREIEREKNEARKLQLKRELLERKKYFEYRKKKVLDRYEDEIKNLWRTREHLIKKRDKIIKEMINIENRGIR